MKQQTWNSGQYRTLPASQKSWYEQEMEKIQTHSIQGRIWFYEGSRVVLVKIVQEVGEKTFIQAI